MSGLLILATAMYAIVGGPSVGKTSIIEALKEEGELTLREVATDYIMEKQKQGISVPWEEDNFQLHILEEHLARETRVLEDAIKKHKVRIFTDRGIFDNYVYLDLRGKKNSEEFKKVDKIIKDQKIKNHYTAIFYVKPLKGFTCQRTKERHEDDQEALKISDLTYRVYKQFCSMLIEVPSDMTPKERAKFILGKVEEIEKKL